jgi:class 3 adenylate cyclase
MRTGSRTFPVSGIDWSSSMCWPGPTSTHPSGATPNSPPSAATSVASRSLTSSCARRAVGCAGDPGGDRRGAFADASPPLRVRIGVHTGDALHEADRFYGTAVHYAARVASNALDGEVLVSNLVRELVAGADVGFRESRDVEPEQERRGREPLLVAMSSSAHRRRRLTNVFRDRRLRPMGWHEPVEDERS